VTKKSFTLTLSLALVALVVIYVFSTIVLNKHQEDSTNLGGIGAIKAASQEDGKKIRYCHSQSVDNINPVLSGVKKVVITVDVRPLSKGTPEEQVLIPEPLRKKNLEKVLKELYTERFSSHNGTLLSGPTPGCHDRNDQPVIIVNTDNVEGRKTFKKYTKEENTLSIILKLSFTPQGYFGLDMNSDVVSFYVSQLRPDVGDYEKNGYLFPFFITLSTPSETIEGFVRGALKNKIN